MVWSRQSVTVVAFRSVSNPYRVTSPIGSVTLRWAKRASPSWQSACNGRSTDKLLRAIEEAWEIEPTVKASFDLFLIQRNLLIHGITTNGLLSGDPGSGRESALGKEKREDRKTKL